jgi:hypothetical protein
MQPRIVFEILPFPHVPRFLSLMLFASSPVRLLRLIAEHLRLPANEFALDLGEFLGSLARMAL